MPRSLRRRTAARPAGAGAVLRHVLHRAGFSVAGLALLLTLGCSPDRPPNVLLVVLDTARADALGAYLAAGVGGTAAGRWPAAAAYGESAPFLPALAAGETGAPPATPRLDQLAADGVLYPRARSTSAWTVPAHGSLFTGLYPSRHGAHHEHPALADELTTLAELLAPTHRSAGFSENPHIGGAKGFAQGFSDFEETWRVQESAADIAPTDERALAWLAARDPDRPFFLFVNFMAPHLPYAPPEPHRGRFLPPDAPPEIVAWLTTANEWAARLYMTGQQELTPQEIEILRSLYRAEVAFADARLGRLLDALATAGELERTLVIVVGDHGENLVERGLMEHQFSLHDSLLRVPLVLRLPGAFDGGRRPAAPAQLVDVAPTVLDALGVPAERWPAFEGTSLLAGGPPASRPQIAEYFRPTEQRWRFERVAPEFDFAPLERRRAALVLDEKKLIVADGEPPRLYDLAADPAETVDLAGREPELTERLARWLERWRAQAPTAGDREAPELDEETREALRALGYID